ncbi:MAG: adenosylmethionine decarboxylase [Gallionella sp.]|nr:adenosylmethionine decarboxylase [Gallionella sp.]
MQDTLNFTERIDDRETLRARSVMLPFDAGAPVVRDGFRFAGTHLLLDLWNARSLDDVEAMEQAFRSAVDAAGATLLNLHFHRFTCGGGLSGLALLAESHISIHTWPEHAFAAVDIFMCGGARPYQAAQVLREALRPEFILLSEHRRGIRQ